MALSVPRAAHPRPIGWLRVNRLAGVENIWEETAPLAVPGLRIDHRMTVIRLANGNLVVHSPIAYSERLGAVLLEHGKPAWFIAPSRFHDLYWPEWFRAFPKATFVAAPGLRLEHPDLPFTARLGAENFWDGELSAIAIQGMPRINEYAFFHAPSRSLIVADLIFNLDAPSQNLLGRLFLRLNAIYARPGISRIFRSYIRDKAAFSDSMTELLAQPVERIILGHGANLGGRAVLQKALTEAGIPHRLP